jgi:hypothetical protein
MLHNKFDLIETMEDAEETFRLNQAFVHLKVAAVPSWACFPCMMLQRNMPKILQAM